MKAPVRSKFDIAILGLLVIITLGIGLLYFISSQIVRNNQLIEQTKLEIKGQYMRRERFDELFTQYQEITSHNGIQDLASILPSADSFVKVIEELETIAQLSGNQIIMNLGETRLTKEGFEIDLTKLPGAIQTTKGNYNYVEIELTVRGSYTALEQFINLFQRAKYYMNVQDLTVNRVTLSSTQIYLDTHMKIRVFVQKVIQITE